MIQSSLQGLGSVGHPGIFIGQSKDFLGLRNHIDIPYVLSLAPENPLDFGVLDLWALKQRSDSPMLSLAIDNAQVIRTDAEFYEFSLPSAQDQTTRLVSGGLDGRDKFGMDGEEFPIIVTKNDLSPGSIFKFDLTSRISFTVAARTIEQVGKHFKVWVKLNTNGFVKYVTKAEFVPQRQIVKLADIGGLDFRANESSWSASSMGNARYRNYISNARLQQSYRVTTGAVEYLQSRNRFDGAMLKAMETAVLQFYTIKGIADNQVIDLNNGDSYKQWFERIQDERAKGNGELMMINLLDSIAINLMQKQNNEVMVWSDGINQIVDGYDTQRLIPGIWFQLDYAGYKHTYSLPTFSLDTLKNAIRDFEQGKVAPRENISDNVYIIKTGRGGQELIYNAFMKAGFNVPAQVMNDTHGFLTGDANNLRVKAARIVEMQVPGLGYIRVQYEPGFDPTFADEFVNPTLEGGHRLTSYTMLIEDYNLSGNNVAIIRKNGESNIQMQVESGTQTHPMFRTNTRIAGQNISVHQSSDRKTGYNVHFTGRADTAILKDPTKLLKLVPKNPKTGRAAL
jgi:hypothetical protein